MKYLVISIVLIHTAYGKSRKHNRFWVNTRMAPLFPHLLKSLPFKNLNTPSEDVVNRNCSTILSQ